MPQPLLAKPRSSFLICPQDPSLCSLQRHLPGCLYPPGYSCLPLANTCKDISPFLVSQRKDCPREQQRPFSCTSLSQHCLGILALTGEQSFAAPAWKTLAGSSPLQGDLLCCPPEGSCSHLGAQQGVLLIANISASSKTKQKHTCSFLLCYFYAGVVPTQQEKE